ncbi:hypothetical protein BATDEDRAFT_22728 [Batrachochytrium dendrobatidis JAM81]|uniref:Uncharacterized protein n=1 Tax=Batrachochytrium dendrobatidis (strain JAM81 / FGSC 10211) TaxID=684364 RepID=F4NXE0_BATDJ|nr:uncharacterized protein BATDEDRAFT_22728 [Batrachochytrium dendrobatidis JAM81]EGF82662.1 hypothetical protein BATDEDRAFT_22728 [Batrachochytrium dendrobatidis JAM81]|eukprot:XP_006676608.1 hypothetical protein BATDEDRAFT_22728 [Batrachochytrium dendrobatidis JAM81]
MSVVTAVLVCIAFTLHFYFSMQSPHRIPECIARLGDSAIADHKLYLATTTHARYYPVRHFFKYSLFYAGFDLDALAAEKSGFPKWLFGHNRRAIVSLWDCDYLSTLPLHRPDWKDKNMSSLDQFTTGSLKTPSIRQSLLEHLKILGYHSEDVGRIELVTTPRILGYAFNPLSMYYVYKSDDQKSLLLVLLEVNNTFKERHLYLCNERTSMIKTLLGYTSSYSVSRSFHVSPFNNRSGIYEVHILDPTKGKLDVLLNIKQYKDTCGSSSDNYNSRVSSNTTTDYDIQKQSRNSTQIHLMARVYGVAYPFTTVILLYVLLIFPFNAFLTVPRIMYEAIRLAYNHKLVVYQRPAPVVGIQENAAKTIVHKSPDTFQRACLQIVLDHLNNQVAISKIHINVSFPNGSSQLIAPIGQIGTDSSPLIQLYIDSYNAFIKLALHASNPVLGLLLAFTSGDMYCSKHDLSLLFSCLAAVSESPSDSSLFEDESALVDYMLNSVSYLDDISRKSPDQHFLTSPLVQIPVKPNYSFQFESGKYLHSLETAWFKMSTTFVKHGEPWLLPVRSKSHISSFQIGVKSEYGGMKRFLPDTIDPFTREQIRAHYFLGACVDKKA